MGPAFAAVAEDGFDEPELVTTSATTTRQSAAATATAPITQERFQGPRGNWGR